MQYKVLHIAKHSETEEDLVTYQQLYGNRDVWARPLDMFRDTVKREEYEGTRFTFMSY